MLREEFIAIATDSNRLVALTAEDADRVWEQNRERLERLPFEAFQKVVNEKNTIATVLKQ